MWPSLSSMPDFNSAHPKWRPQNLADVLPEMEGQALSLLERMLVYDPSRRITGASLYRPFVLRPGLTTAPSARSQIRPLAPLLLLD